jgi:hypothetical protein
MSFALKLRISSYMNNPVYAEMRESCKLYRGILYIYYAGEGKFCICIETANTQLINITSGDPI